MNFSRTLFASALSAAVLTLTACGSSVKLDDSASSGAAPRENAESSKNAAGKVTLKPEAEAGPSSGHEDLPTSVSVNL